METLLIHITSKRYTKTILDCNTYEVIEMVRELFFSEKCVKSIPNSLHGNSHGDPCL